MAEIKLTKNELRAQEQKLGQLEKYLPTLQLKKALLQSEVYDARLEIKECEGTFKKTFAAGSAPGRLCSRYWEATGVQNIINGKSAETCSISGAHKQHFQTIATQYLTRSVRGISHVFEPGGTLIASLSHMTD